MAKKTTKLSTQIFTIELDSPFREYYNDIQYALKSLAGIDELMAGENEKNTCQ